MQPPDMPVGALFSDRVRSPLGIIRVINRLGGVRSQVESFMTHLPRGIEHETA